VIVVRLQGGLGNQMFQYAAGARLARKHNTTLHLDLSWFRRQATNVTLRRYELGCFHIDAMLDGAELVRAAGLGYGGRFGALVTRARAKLPCRFHVLREATFAVQPDVLRAPDNSYLIGYWQAESYFADIAHEIRSTFALKTPPGAENARTLEEISRSTAVSLHIRRGDYSRAKANRTHGMPSIEYYARAAEYVASRTAEPHFFVFSDEPAWSRHFLKLNEQPMTFVTNNTVDAAHEDLRLMSACNHQILANSSFSWWGAWLNADVTKIVVAPKHWFRDSSIDTRDIYVKDWITL
jgi:Glycosyl transferase family 11